MKIIYIASPYTSPLHTIVEQRVAAVTAFTVSLVEQGIPAFSPIVYFHPIAKARRLPTDAQWWHNINMSFLRYAEAMFVLHLDGWDRSQGVKIELAMAKIANIPVVHFGPDGKEIN